MTLPQVQGAGLNTATGHTVFPETQREVVRSITPWEPADHLTDVETREGGAVRHSFQPSQDSPVDARIDPTSGSTQAMRGAVLHEDTTHVVTFRLPRSIAPDDRIRMHGHEWAITSVREATDEPTTQVEVMVA